MYKITWNLHHDLERHIVEDPEWLLLLAMLLERQEKKARVESKLRRETCSTKERV